MRVPGSPGLAWVWIVISLPLAGIGCSGSGGLSPVHGKVLHKKAPIKGVLVIFHPKGGNPITAVRPTGYTKDDGTFSLTTGDKQGAAAGDYIVTFICSKEVATKGKRSPFDQTPVETEDYFAGAYADTKRSGHKVEVKNGTNNLAPFELK